MHTKTTWHLWWGLISCNWWVIFLLSNSRNGIVFGRISWTDAKQQPQNKFNKFRGETRVPKWAGAVEKSREECWEEVKWVAKSREKSRNSGENMWERVGRQKMRRVEKRWEQVRTSEKSVKYPYPFLAHLHAHFQYQVLWWTLVQERILSYQHGGRHFVCLGRCGLSG